MMNFILLSAPVFGVVTLGWFAARRRVATPAALDALTAFSFRFALPALVYRLIAGQPLGRVFNPAFYGGYLAGGTLVFVLAFTAARLAGVHGVGAAGARATTATVSNVGFLGPPIMLAFFGQRGAGPLAMAILAEVMVLLSLGSVLMGVDRIGLKMPGWAQLRGSLFNPVVVGILLGAVVAASGIAVPSWLNRLLEFLGGAAGPTALFALGGALATQRIDRSTRLAAAGIAAMKLVVYPLIIWAVLAHLLHLDGFWVHAGVVVAALPSAGSSFVVAQRYGTDAEGISAAIALSTVVSVITVPIAAWLVLQP